MKTITYHSGNANFDQWVDDLATTAEGQAQGKLAEVDPETGKVTGYCCLGFGPAICMHVPVQVHVIQDSMSPDETQYDEFGSLFGMRELAPIEFRQWLGIKTGGHIEQDVFIDWSDLRDLRTQGGRAEHENYQPPLVGTLTCAGLNDAGFTFKQIADVLRYFGIIGEEES